MLQFFRILLVLGLIAGLATVAVAREKRAALPMPVPQGTTPQWTPVPGAPGVEHAPNLGADLFRHGGGYYYQHEGKWYQGRTTTGPWSHVQSVPQAFYQVQAPYFKQPPGWAKGKKTGWGGAPMPPGQMKKQGGGPHVPPGHMKKYGQ